ncbi:hypothetical protein BHM03_00057531 [Ensete ventricosum]|nr:hypothetical protein BHM03_00057531 [Ensete ventricosum]
MASRVFTVKTPSHSPSPDARAVFDHIPLRSLRLQIRHERQVNVDKGPVAFAFLPARSKSVWTDGRSRGPTPLASGAPSRGLMCSQSKRDLAQILLANMGACRAPTTPDATALLIFPAVVVIRLLLVPMASSPSTNLTNTHASSLS